MFKIKSPILDFFKFILRITFEFTLDTYHKSLEITKFLSKKKFKLFLRYGDIVTFVKPMMTFILGLLEGNTLIEEKNSKQDTINLSGLSTIKRIFTLLAKVVIVYL